MNKQDKSFLDLQEFYENEYERGTNIAGIPEKDDFMYGCVINQLCPYLSPGIEVLDFGCNTGNLSLYMANRGCNVLGVDIARNAIELAKKSASYYKTDNVRFASIGSFSELNEFDKFDFVLINNVIEHIPEDCLFLKKIHDSMKSGARLLLSTAASYSSLYRTNVLLTGECKFDVEVGHLRRYNKQQIESLLELAGFKVSKIVFSDGILRDWFIVYKPLRIFNLIWRLPYVRRIFNGIDSLTAAKGLFPTIIFVHAEKE